jgi:hypothetical protein
VAHSTVSHFIKVVDATLMRLNLVLLLFVDACRPRVSATVRRLNEPGRASVVPLIG